MPGLDDKSVEIRLSNGTLTIRGEKKEEKGKRILPLRTPLGIIPKDVTLPKSAAAQASEKRIRIEAD